MTVSQHQHYYKSSFNRNFDEIPVCHLDLAIGEGFSTNNLSVKRILYVLESAVRNNHIVILHLNLDNSFNNRLSTIFSFFNLLLKTNSHKENSEIRINDQFLDYSNQQFIRSVINEIFDLNIVFQNQTYHNYAA